ncbi:MAG: hypothetical protein HY784_08435 [Chloroflexi bacterium]|nr:hypothetical protein [Chloroflexota bacterium]
MSRQKQLEAAAQLVGNAAAHIALYRAPTGVREALEYFGQAQIRVETRRWNQTELARFRMLALRRVAREIAERIGETRGRAYEEAVAEAARWMRCK